MKRVGFITYAGEAHLTADDQLAVAALARRGVEVVPQIWDQSSAEALRTLDAIVFRSCWDYHLKHEKFAAWIAGLRALGMPVFNAPDVLLWNLDKRHLVELQRRGVELPRTALVEAAAPPAELFRPDHRAPLAEQSARWAEKLREFSDEIVIKPTISLNGFDTFRLKRTDTERAQAVVREILAQRRDVLIQDFVPEIASQGETSLLFFGGEFSHASRKLPRTGEFRVQAEHGGRRVHIDAPQALIDRAREILVTAGLPVEELLYARVDGVELPGGRFVLMEIEVLDPSLYLEDNPLAADRFAAALVARI
jgi:glutathione synthase/RimK-type ligase-like ATP-grasp enzyme